MDKWMAQARRRVLVIAGTCLIKYCVFPTLHIGSICQGRKDPLGPDPAFSKYTRTLHTNTRNGIKVRISDDLRVLLVCHVLPRRCCTDIGTPWCVRSRSLPPPSISTQYVQVFFSFLPTACSSVMSSPPPQSPSQHLITVLLSCVQQNPS